MQHDLAGKGGIKPIVRRIDDGLNTQVLKALTGGCHTRKIDCIQKILAVVKVHRDKPPKEKRTRLLVARKQQARQSSKPG